MMEAKTTDKRTFQLTENNLPIGEIIYENLFFLKAEIHLVNAEKYRIKPVGFFHSSILVTQNEEEIAHMVMSWNGEIIITFLAGNEYSVKLKGILSDKFTVENKNRDKVLQIDSKYSWKTFQYTHKIVYTVDYRNRPKDNLLPILGIYAVNYFIATMSGANAGIM